MRLPFLGRKGEDSPIRLPLPELVEIPLAVYFQLRASGPPAPEALPPVVLAWLDRYTEEPLRGMLRAFVENGKMLQLSVHDLASMPPPPMEYLQAFRPGEVEERRLAEATHSVWVVGMDLLQHPRAGLWATIAAARALAHASGGVVLDLEFPRLLPIDSYTTPLPADAYTRMVDHLLIPNSIDRRGLAWVTTKGMQKFGLPEMEIVDAPPNLIKTLWTVVNGVAHYLMAATLKQAEEREEPAKELAVGPEIRLELKHVAFATGGDPEAAPAAGARGWSDIRLEYRKGRRDESSFLRICKPRSFKGDHGVWLHSLLSDLYGSEQHVLDVPSDSESMDAAHLQAVSELPRVRQRFQEGLPPGVTLHIKHGFLVRDDFHEYMWVAVNTWQGDRLRGQLANDPMHRLDLRAGQTVDIREAEVFDWLIMHPDGTMEGAYTNRVAEQQGQ